MDANSKLELQTEIIKVLKEIFDPEIPVNIYDLGLIYEVNVDEDGNVQILMTLTAPNCPMADFLLQEVKDKVNELQKVRHLDVEITFEPPWQKNMMSDEAMLDLGLL